MANNLTWNELRSAIEERSHRGEPVRTSVRFNGRLMRLLIADELIEDHPRDWQTIVERKVRTAAAMGAWPHGLDALSIISDGAPCQGQRAATSF